MITNPLQGFVESGSSGRYRSRLVFRQESTRQVQLSVAGSLLLNQASREWKRKDSGNEMIPFSVIYQPTEQNLWVRGRLRELQLKIWGTETAPRGKRLDMINLRKDKDRGMGEGKENP